jgi:hypothetical protein
MLLEAELLFCSLLYPDVVQGLPVSFDLRRRGIFTDGCRERIWRLVVACHKDGVVFGHFFRIWPSKLELELELGLIEGSIEFS